MNNCGRAVLLGIFDGLHLGHLSAVRELMKYPGEKIVYTFKSATVSTKGSRKLLLTDPEKREMLFKLGADKVVSEDFETVKNLSAPGFLKTVVMQKLGCSAVIAGENFRFGSGALAGEKELRELSEALGLRAVIVPTVLDGGEAVSTTRIRRLIERGEIGEANRLLGRKYSVFGEILKEGFAPCPEKVLPPKGSYRAELDGRELAAAVGDDGLIFFPGEKIPEKFAAELKFIDRI